MFMSLEAILDGETTVFDNADPTWRTTGMSTNSTHFNFRISQYYVMDASKHNGPLRISKAINEDQANWLNIIPAVTLHPLIMSGKEQRPDQHEIYKNGSIMTDHIEKVLKYIENKMIPELRLLNSTSILMDSEPI